MRLKEIEKFNEAKIRVEEKEASKLQKEFANEIKRDAIEGKDRKRNRSYDKPQQRVEKDADSEMRSDQFMGNDVNDYSERSELTDPEVDQAYARAGYVDESNKGKIGTANDA